MKKMEKAFKKVIQNNKRMFGMKFQLEDTRESKIGKSFLQININNIQRHK